MFDMKRCAAVVAGGLLPLLSVPFTVGQADASSAVRISSVQYDSPGSDTGSNYSLNGEWVRITNYSSTRKTLSGWTLRDTSSHVYRFGIFTLGAGKSVRIHTGKGSNTAADRYQNRGWYVWNNTNDKAILRNGSGTTVSVRSW
jgi:hypothetical protein